LISQILSDINNHFPRTAEYGNYTFTPASANTTISGTFSDHYAVGQYIYIKNSILNDGVYHISGVSASLTVDSVLQAETTTDGIWVYGLAIPSDVLSLVADIETWVTNNAGTEGVNSESIGRYSVSYKNGGGWQPAFRSRLNGYRCIKDSTDFNQCQKNWQNKMGCY
jgi:hypothetical protein